LGSFYLQKFRFNHVLHRFDVRLIPPVSPFVSGQGCALIKFGVAPEAQSGHQSVRYLDAHTFALVSVRGHHGAILSPAVGTWALPDSLKQLL
jgi:hypothetical protein